MGKLRADGGRKVSTRELAVVTQLYKSGNRDIDIANMIGRTERSVRGIREYYGLVDSEKYKRTGAKFSPAEDKVINARLRDWVQCQKLTSKQMETRLRELHPPGLHYATILTRIKKISPYLWQEHQANCAAKRARHMKRRHIKGGCRTQPRTHTGQYMPKESVQCHST